MCQKRKEENHTLKTHTDTHMQTHTHTPLHINKPKMVNAPEGLSQVLLRKDSFWPDRPLCFLLRKQRCLSHVAI